jgi:hypothetical protein
MIPAGPTRYASRSHRLTCDFASDSDSIVTVTSDSDGIRPAGSNLNESHEIDGRVGIIPVTVTTNLNNFNSLRVSNCQSFRVLGCGWERPCRPGMPRREPYMN